MFKHRNEVLILFLRSSHRQKELPVSCWWEQPSRKLMAGSYQTLGAIHRMAVQRGQRTFLQSLTEDIHAVPKMSDTENYCWWMRRKEIDTGPLKEALKGKQPFLPFLSFCGLTIPKHCCCSACQGGFVLFAEIPNATMGSRPQKQVLLKAGSTCHLRSSACRNH